DNSIIHNNQAVETGEAIYLINTKQAETTINVNIYRSNITQNTINRNIYLGGGEIPVGSILLDLNWYTFPINITANISECIIEDTTIYSKANTTLEKSVFNKSNIRLSADIKERRRNNTLASNIFDATTIRTEMDVNVYNNTFTNGTGLTILLNQKGYNSQDNYGTISNIIEIHDNKFVNRARITCEYIDSNFSETYKIYNNTYENALSTDNLILNVPNKIYTGEPITITGTYTLKNPEYYDEDILEQNKFQVYINDELVDTVNTLEFTITPTTTENMLITIQPTISQTIKSAIIQASTLNFTLEPITATIGETAQITAQITLITDDTEMEVNDGRVYFKVNGKILRDVNTGRILYADVTDNTATLDYQVPKTWNEDTELEAVFTGNDEIPQVTSNTVNPSITTPETSQTEFSVADTTATAGEEV
ncbi:MAG: hypothetical protein BZ136_08740, partial [Methanosphaera sp. rholeuAM74]